MLKAIMIMNVITVICFSSLEARMNFYSFLPKYSIFQEKVHNDTLMIDEWLAKADKLLSSNLPDSALIYLHKAYPLTVKYKLTIKEVRTIALLSTYCQHTGMLEKGSSLIDMAFRKSENIRNPELQVRLHNLAAINSKQTGGYTKSAWHYFQALNIIEQHGVQNPYHSIQTYINTGTLWRRIGETAQALKMFHEAELQIKNNMDNPACRKLLPYVLIGIGQTYVFSKPDTAIHYFQKAYSLAGSNRQPYVEQFATYSINNTYLEQGKYDLVLDYLKLAETNPYFKTDISRIHIHYLSGQLYQKLNQPGKAVQYLLTALRLSEKTKSKEMISGIYQYLNKAYVDLNQYKLAHHYQEMFLNYIEKTSNYESRGSVNLLLKKQMTAKETENEEMKLKLMLKQKEIREKNAWIIVITVISLLLLALFIQHYRNARNKQKLLNEREQNLFQQQEIEKLKAIAEGEERERMRIAYELHDGVMVRFATVKMKLNTLPNNNSQLFHTESYKGILEHFDQATAELRRTAHNLMPDILLNEGITQAIYYFCKTIQETTGLHLVFRQYGNLPRFRQEFEVSIYRMVQELIQNIIKHASAEKAIVQINHRSELLSVTVEDNGCGFIVGSTPNKGWGLKGLSSRVRIFNGNLDIQSNPGMGTTVYFEFDTRSLTV